MSTTTHAYAPILKYPGSKGRIAPWITSHFPAHTHYIEPYLGSGSVFFAKEPSAHEVLNDLDSSVVNLFRVLRTRGEELAEMIALTPWSEEEYKSIERDYEGTGDEVEDARRFLIRCWMAHGVRLAWTSGFRHNGLKGRAYPVRLWRKLPERLVAVIERLRDAEIRQLPAIDILERYNAPDCLAYVDPPYLRATRSHDLYRYEMTDDQHVSLLDALNSYKGMVVLSGYSNPLYEGCLQHWQRVTINATAEHGNARTEVIWLNQRAQQRQMELWK